MRFLFFWFGAKKKRFAGGKASPEQNAFTTNNSSVVAVPEGSPLARGTRCQPQINNADAIAVPHEQQAIGPEDKIRGRAINSTSA